MPQKSLSRSSRSSQIQNPQLISHKIFKETFFVGAEPQQYNQIYSHNWKFDSFTNDIQEGKLLYNALLQNKYVYIFGQTEPTLDANQQSVQVPILIVIISDRELQMSIVCKSVQSTEMRQLELSELNLTVSSQLIGRVLLDESNKGRRGRFARRDLQLNYLHCTRTRHLPSLDDVDKINNYTYGNLFVDTQSACENFSRQIRRPTMVTIEIEHKGEKKEATFDVSGGLRFQAKEALLKHFLRPKDFQSVDIDKEEVDTALIDQVVAAVKASAVAAEKDFETRKAAADAAVAKAKEKGAENIQIIKYYGALPGDSSQNPENTQEEKKEAPKPVSGFQTAKNTSNSSQLQIQKSQFVNRFLGRAEEVK